VLCYARPRSPLLPRSCMPSRLRGRRSGSGNSCGSGETRVVGRVSY
jgi:hypothetical protein